MVFCFVVVVVAAATDALVCVAVFLLVCVHMKGKDCFVGFEPWVVVVEDSGLSISREYMSPKALTVCLKHQNVDHNNRNYKPSELLIIATLHPSYNNGYNKPTNNSNSNKDDEDDVD